MKRDLQITLYNKMRSRSNWMKYWLLVILLWSGVAAVGQLIESVDFSIDQTSNLCEGGIPTFNVLVEMEDGIEYDLDVTIENSVDAMTFGGVLSNSTQSRNWNSVINSTTEFRLIEISYNNGNNLLSTPIPRTFLVAPTSYDLTGDNKCGAAEALVIGLTGSQDGVTYQLLRNNVPLLSPTPVVGDGNPMTDAFSVNTPGVYTVQASSSGCDPVLMSGTKYLRIKPTDVPFKSTADACGTGAITLATSQTGVTYKLFRDGGDIGVSISGNDGNEISFGDRGPGSYTVEATSGGGCNTTITNERRVLSLPTSYSLSASKSAYCSTAPVSGVNLTLSGSQSGITYQLFSTLDFVNPVGTQVVGIGEGGDPLTWSNVEEGTYYVTASNGVCEIEMSNRRTIKKLPPPTATISASSVDRKCEGATSEFRVTVALTGTAPFNFDVVNNVNGDVTHVTNHGTSSWTSGVLNFDESRTYTVENVSDGSGCDLVDGTGAAEFFVDPLPVVQFNPTAPELCVGSAMDITASGAGPGGSYVWSDGLGTGATAHVSPPSSTTYTVTATTDRGCRAAGTVPVTVHPLPTLDFTPPLDDYSVCVNGGNVSLTPNIPGGSYSINGVNMGSGSFDPAAAGVGTHPITYSLTDGNLCSNSVTKNLVVLPAPTVSISDLRANYCADDPDATILGNPRNNVGGGSFDFDGRAEAGMWRDNGDGTMNLSPSGILGDAGVGTYYVKYTYTDSEGCTSSATRTTTINDDLGDAVRFRGLPTSTCETGNEVTLQAFLLDGPNENNINTGDGRFSGAGITDHGNGTATFDPSVAGNGLHTITYNYTDPVTGCTGSYSQHIQIGTTLVVHGVNSVFCVDDGIQQFWGEPQPGDATNGWLRIYSWDGADETTEVEVSAKIGTTSTNTLPFTPDVAGNYLARYEYSDGDGCVNTHTIPFRVDADIDASFVAYITSIANATDQFCIDAGIVTLAPATGASPGGYFSGTGVVGGNRFNPKLAGVGTHTIERVVSTDNCSDTETMDITVYETLVEIALPKFEFCINDDSGSFLVEANNLEFNGTEYAGTEVDAIYTFHALSPSPLYTVAGGVRTYHSSFKIEVGDTDPLYFDPAKIRPDATEDFVTHITLLYNNTAKEGGCLSTIVSKDIEIKIAPEVNFGTSNPMLFCQDDSPRTIQGSYSGGGFTGSGNFYGQGIEDLIPDDGQAIFNPSLVGPGSFDITYTFENTANGCISKRVKTFEVRETPTIYTITPLSSTPNAGRYCEGGAGAVIGVPSSQSDVNYLLVKDGNVSAPKQILPGTGSSLSFDPVTEEGVYTVVAKWAAPSDCSSVMNGSVKVKSNKVVATVESSGVSCFDGEDGTITVTAQGGSLNYVYQISEDGTTYDPEVGSNVFNDLKAGTYHIKVKDAIGCELSTPIEVEIKQSASALTITTDTKPSGCDDCTEDDDCEGEASVEIEGGTPFDTSIHPSGYNVVWKSSSGDVLVASAQGKIITKKPAGEYSVTVTDANGCTVSETVTIDEVADIVLAEDLTEHKNVTCFGSSTGEFVVTATGGDPSANYQFSLDGTNWTSGAVATPSAKTYTRPAGIYRVWVRDANYPRCIYELPAPVVITQPAKLELSEVDTSHEDVTCYNGDDGKFEVIAVGGTTNAGNLYNYSIDAGTTWENSPIFENLSEGIYNVSVRDANGCIASGVTVEIKENTAVGLTLDSKLAVTCNGGDNGSLTVKASGGDGNYQYSIDAGTIWQNSPTFNKLEAGTYAVTVRDGNGCITTRSNISIVEPAILVITEDVAKHKNVSCFGGNNGSLSVNVTGGSGAYEFSINGGTWQSSALPKFTFNDLAFGNYEVTVRDENDPTCSVISSSILITQPSAPLAISLIEIKDNTCFEGSDGSVEVSVAGGTPNYQYRWYRMVAGVQGSPVGTTSVASNLSAGEYKVVVTDNQSCTTDRTYTVGEPTSRPVITVENIDHVTVLNGSDGGIQISVAGGTEPYNYEWSGEDFSGTPVTGLPSATSQSNLKAGVYKVIVTDATGCVISNSNIIVSQPGVNLNLTITKTNPGPCHGASNGKIGLSVYGGNIPYASISLTRGGVVQTKSTSGNSFANYEGLVAGTYIARVVDATDVVYNQNVVLTQPDELQLTFGKDKDVSCYGESDGAISFTVTGGTPLTGNEYSVSLIPSVGAARAFNVVENVSHSISDLKADEFWTLRVTDSNGCYVEEVFEITQPLPINMSANVKNLSCNGSDDGAITFTVSGGRGAGTQYIYDWIKDGTPYLVDGGSTQTNLEPGKYSVEVRELSAPNCPASSSVYTITEPPILSIDAKGYDVTTCHGDNSGKIEVTVYGGVAPYVVDYGSGTLLSGDGPLFTIDNLYAGAYNITVTDNNGAGCIESKPVQINEPAELMTLSNLITNIDCETPNTGRVSFELQGGVTKANLHAYRAVLVNTTNSSSWVVEVTGTINQPEYLNFNTYSLPAGNYKLTVTDVNAAPLTSCGTIEEVFTLSHIGIAAQVVDATCSGVNTGEIKNINITGGSGDYTSVWTTTDGGLGLDNSKLNQTGLSAGKYELEITDNVRGCSITKQYEVKYAHEATVTASVKGVTCAGAANGMINNVSATGFADPSIVVYHWVGPGVNKTMNEGDPDFDANLYNLTGGTYLLTVTDNAGCSVTESFVVKLPAPIEFTLSTQLIDCDYARSITISGLTGGTGVRTFVWNGPGSFTQTGQSITGITEAGIYTVTVFDGNNCKTTKSITVPGKMKLSAELTYVQCFGDNKGNIVLDVEGGSGNYTYLWTGTDVVSGDRNQNNLTAGEYTVVVTDIGQSCGGGDYHTVTRTFTITEPTELKVSGEVTNVLCANDGNGKITLSPEGGSGSYQYSWSSANGTGLVQGSKNQTGLSGGQYSVIVTDAVTGCHSKSTNFTVVEPDELAFVLTVEDTKCDLTNSLEITNPSGGSNIPTNYEYSWAGPGITTSTGVTQNNLPGGVYTIRMSDRGISKLCYVEKQVTLTKPLKISAVVQDETCPDSKNGKIDLTVEHGKKLYSYVWTDANGDQTANYTNLNQSSLAAGKYKVVVTDARTCTIDLTVEVGLTNALELHGSITNVNCHGDDSGAINLTVVGGSGNYDYEWSSVGFSETTKDISGLTAGAYQVTVTDNTLGCVVHKSFSVTQPTAEIELTATVTDVKCKGSATGEIAVEVTGGTVPYKYEWSAVGGGNPSVSAEDQTGLLAGDYHLRIIDDRGCIADFGPFKVKEPAQALKITLEEVLHVNIHDGSNGAIEVDATGGTGNYNYVWVKTSDPTFVSTSTNRQEGLKAGSYEITVTDDNDCKVTLQQVVSEPGGLLNIVSSVKHVRPCSNNANGELLVQVTGGTPSMVNGTPEYHIIVRKGGSVIEEKDDVSVNLTGLTAGKYNIEVKDDNGIVITKEETITAPPPLVVVVKINNPVTCYEGSDASVTVTVSGGKHKAGEGYRLQLLGGSIMKDTVVTNNVTFPDLPEGTYEVRVWDDANGDGSFSNADALNDDCFYKETLIITQPEAEITLSVVSGSEDICVGTQPQLQLLATNWNVETDPLQITLNDGTIVTMNSSPFVLDADTPPVVGVFEYSIVSVEDATSCAKGFGQGTGNVTVRPLPTGNLAGNDRICLGESSVLSVNLTGTAPWSITYSHDGSLTTVDDISTSPHQITVNTLVTTTYKLEDVSDIYCTNSGTGSAVITVDQPTELELLAKDTPEICRGDSFDLFFKFAPNTNGPWRVTWTETVGTVVQTKSRNIAFSDLMTAVDSIDLFKLTVSPLATTTYKLVSAEVTNGSHNSCAAIIVDQEITVAVNQLPGYPSIITGDTEVCHGETVEYSIGAIAHAISYEWELPSGVTLLSGGGTRAIEVLFTDLAASGNIRVRGTNLCAEGPYRQLSVKVNKYPGVVDDITGPTELCQGATEAVFSVDPMFDATGYKWTVPTGMTFTGQNTSSIRVALDPNLDNFTGEVMVTPFNDCGESVTTKKHTFTVYPSPVANAGLDDHICGTSTTLAADSLDADWTGKWTLVQGYGNFANDTEHNTAVSEISRGDVTFRWTVEHTHTTVTCRATDEVTIRNNQLSVSASALKNRTCDGEVEVTALAATSGKWSVVYPVGSSAMIDDANANQTTISNLMPGENKFRWTHIQNGCESFAEVTVINEEPDKAVIDGIKTVDVCDDTVDLSANEAEVGDGVWTVTKGYGHISDIHENDITITALARGENIFRYTISTGNCSTYDEVTVRNNQLEVDAGKDQPTCDASAIMDASLLPPNTIGAWEFSKGTGSFIDGTSPTSRVTDLAVDDNILVWKVTKNGCVSTDTVTITNNQPTIAAVGSTQSKCDFETILTGNEPVQGTGRWSIAKGSGDFENITDPETEVTNLGLGENIFRWTIKKGACSTFADLKVMNRKVEVDAGKDFSTCTRVATMNGSQVPEGATGQWTVLPGVGGGTIPILESKKRNAQISGLDYGLNAFVWTVSNGGCISSDTVYVNNSMPFPVEAGPNQTINGTVVDMNATVVQHGKGTWTLVSGGGTIAPADIHKANARVTDLRRGENVFRWTVINGDCSEYDEVVIVNGEVVTADAGDDQTVCNSEAFLEANDPDVALGNWSIVSGNARFENRNDPKTRVYDLADGDNVLRWTISYSASSSSDEVTITNDRPDDARAGADDAICFDHVELKGNTPGLKLGTGEWTLFSGGGNIINPTLSNTEVTHLAKGENQFVYTITNGICTSTDTVTIINGLPTSANAGTDESTCNGSLRLNPNTPTYGTASWRTGSEGSARFEGNWVHELAQGPNELVYVIETDYCTSTDTIVVTNNKPTASVAGNMQDICVDSVFMAASPVLYGEGTWEKISGSGRIVDVHNPSTLITHLSKGENRFKWIVDNNGCKSSSEVIINNNFVQSIAGDQQINCSSSTVLKANNPSPGTGIWGIAGGSGSANFEDVNDPLSAVTNLDRGSNLLTWTVEYKGCVDIDTVEIINNNPTEAKAGQDIPSCEKSVLLAANTPTVGVGTWTIIQGGGEFASTNYADPKNDPGARLNDIKFGDNLLRWTIRHENCVSFDDVVVSYNKVEAIAGDNRTVCSDEVTLEGNSPLPGVGTWSVPGGMGSAVFVDPSSASTVVKSLGKGANTLRWTVSYKGCSTYSDVVIINDLPSAAYAGNTQVLCKDETILDATKPAIGTGSWRVVTGSAVFEDENIHNTRVTNLSQGDNVLVWTTKNNLCTLEDEVLITNNRPSDPYAGASYEEVCSNTFTLKAATPDYGTGLWTIIQGGGTLSNPSNPRTEVTNLDHGTNQLRWTVSQGDCNLSSDVTIENNTPTKANAGPDIQDCKDTHILDANIPTQGTGSWSRVSGYGDFDEKANAKTTVRNLSFGENIFQWTISKGNCSSSDKVTIFNKIPDKAFAGTDQLDLCEDYTVLNANDPVSGDGRWTVVKGKGTFETPSSFNSIVRNVGFGENIYRWEVSYGECSTQDEMVVVSNKTEAYAGEDQVVYKPTALLNANNVGDLGGTWSVVGTSTARLEDPSFFNTSVDNLSDGINAFRWTIDVKGCISSDLVSVDYRPVPDASFITDVEEGCYPLEVLFTNYSVGGSTYMWNFGDGSTSGDRNPTHTFHSPGRFTVTLVSPGPDGKNGEYTKVIDVHDHPVADFTVNPELVFVPGDKARFYDLSSDAISWAWDFGDGNSSTERNPSYTYQEEGIYTVQLEVANQFGCLDTLRMVDLMTAKPQGFVKLPNAFKPRPDGGADAMDPSSEYVVVFKPAHRDVDEFTMEIFNRWGQKIFHTNDIDSGWDGMYEGQLAPQGVYVYKISGKYLNGREYRNTGSVLLVR